MNIPETKLDTFNKFMIGVCGRSVVLNRPLPPSLSARDAMLLAAYLVTMAEIADPTPDRGDFVDWLNAVQST